MCYNKRKWCQILNIKYNPNQATIKAATSDYILNQLFEFRQANEVDQDRVYSSRHDLQSFYKMRELGNIWYIKQNNQIMGYSRTLDDNCELEGDFKELQQHKNLFLKGTFISPQFRGQGLQKRFHKMTNEYIKNKDYYSMIAFVHPDNKASLSNLKKAGFVHYGIRMGSNNTMRILMIKIL